MRPVNIGDAKQLSQCSTSAYRRIPCIFLLCVFTSGNARSNTSYSFIRKSGYYAIFNSGKILSEQQRYGLGLIWNPEIGTFFQSQSSSDMASSDDHLTLGNKQVILQNREVEIKIIIRNGQAVKALVVEADLNDNQCQAIEISATGKLEYDILLKSQID